MRPRIFNDLDGVHVNWEGRAIEMLNLNKAEVIPHLKQGKKLEDICPQIYDLIEDTKENFWEGLELYPWAYDLLDLCQRYGEVAFLSSGGNLHRRTLSVAQANAGKTKYVANNFRQIPLILTREKYLCASPNSILIDDTKNKVDNFIVYGGQGFLFPHPYKILDGELNIEEVFRDLEKKLKEMVN